VERGHHGEVRPRRGMVKIRDAAFATPGIGNIAVLGMA
jgi:hypothetical protein